MSVQALRELVVTGPAININSGLVRFRDDKQASRRAHCLKPVKGHEGVFEVTRSFQVKNGERFEYDGEIPKSLAQNVVSPAEAAKKTTKKKTTGKSV